MNNFELHLDEINEAIDLVMSYAPEVDDRMASRIVTAFYSDGYRIAKLAVSPEGAVAGKGRPAKYDWAGMALTEVRFFPDETDARNKLNSSWRYYAAKHCPGMRCRVVKDANGSLSAEDGVMEVSMTDRSSRLDAARQDGRDAHDAGLWGYPPPGYSADQVVLAEYSKGWWAAFRQRCREIDADEATGAKFRI